MELFEDGPDGPDHPSGARRNAPEFSVSEISGAVKRAIEGEFAHVRVRGEVGRVFRARTGHLYFDLKDDRNVLASVSWKGQAARLSHLPEEGMEVIATGRLTTFGPQSKYQLNVEELQPAGAGALMAMLEKRRKALEAGGLFAAENKRPLPFLPEVIGVVTSPSGAVIRDILHRLRERFPRKVLVWPVAVQGQACAPEVARAIDGFNALSPGGAVPRPDLIIVARGGGSIEDLWGFNEEVVVRAAAFSAIPLISAVGHETDTTLIDHAADRRAPTPTAAAELAVPVRSELVAGIEGLGARLSRGLDLVLRGRQQRLADLARALPRPESLLSSARQRFDLFGERLNGALRQAVSQKAVRLADLGLRSGPLRQALSRDRERLADRAGRLAPALGRQARDGRARLDRVAERLDPAAARRVAVAREVTLRQAGRLTPTLIEERIARAANGSRVWTGFAKRWATRRRSRADLPWYAPTGASSLTRPMRRRPRSWKFSFATAGSPSARAVDPAPRGKNPRHRRPSRAAFCDASDPDLGAEAIQPVLGLADLVERAKAVGAQKFGAQPVVLPEEPPAMRVGIERVDKADRVIPRIPFALFTATVQEGPRHPPTGPVLFGAVDVVTDTVGQGAAGDMRLEFLGGHGGLSLRGIRQAQRGDDERSDHAGTMSEKRAAR